jgi:pimeloyl-ACP methyl ester carboxylesterase
MKIRDEEPTHFSQEGDSVEKGLDRPEHQAGGCQLYFAKMTSRSRSPRISNIQTDVSRRGFKKNKHVTLLLELWRTLERPDGVFGRHRATKSIGTAFLPYLDYANASAMTWIKEGMKKWTGSSQVPAAFALFPKDISQPPREWERFFNVQRWTEMPHGGHFAAMEEPQLLAKDIRAWFRGFREERGTNEN